jgi:hypothetical protein
VAPVRVACRARVLRVEHDHLGGQKGMAAAIQRFDFLESLPSADQSIGQFAARQF